MPQTASSSGDAEQQTADDEEEESFTHGVVQVPRLEDMCRRQAYSNMRESTRRTTVSNLPEEAQIGASNIRHLLMTSLDVRKAFRHTYNLDRVLEGTSCTVCKLKSISMCALAVAVACIDTGAHRDEQ